MHWLKLKVNKGSMKKLLTLLSLLLIWGTILAQPYYHIKSEHEIPPYELPPLLKSRSGKKIKNIKKWEKIRKPEILKLFAQEIYGEVPIPLPIKKTRVIEKETMVFDGLGKRSQVELTFENNNRIVHFDILIYLPAKYLTTPVFIGYNHYGNHTVSEDPSIRLTESWVADNPSFGIVHNQITEQSRGVSSEKWPIKMILEAGYGIATIYHGDIDPDRNNYADGIHPLAYSNSQISPAKDEWGSVAAWSWGLSRAIDYFETTQLIDSKNIILFGNDKLAKAALWATAIDERVAMCIASNSGCLGAALSRRKFGDTVAKLAYKNQNWFCNNLKKYAGMESELPVDQHMLLASIAPRPLFIVSAKDDIWSDPRGEFLSAIHASPVYEMYGLKGITINELPEINLPIDGDISYITRKGKYGISHGDWKHFIRFANKHLNN